MEIVLNLAGLALGVGAIVWDWRRSREDDRQRREDDRQRRRDANVQFIAQRNHNNPDINALRDCHGNFTGIVEVRAVGTASGGNIASGVSNA